VRRFLPLIISILSLVTSTSGADEYPPIKARVAAIAGKVSISAGVEPKISIINSEKPEAYVRPDGAIVVTTGLISLAGSDDEIAFVIGHEVAHITRKHCREGTVMSILNDPKLPEWKRHEIEADINGINYIRGAGYSPFSAEKLLSKMLNYTDVSQEAFRERIDAISIYLTDIGSERHQSFKGVIQ
jgi:predicted Zn-dependent protease